MRNGVFGLLAVLALSACQPSELSTTLPPATSTTVVETTTTTLPPVTTTTLGIDYLTIASEWTVSLRRVGPYLVGMSVDEAIAESGLTLVPMESSDPPCSYYRHEDNTGLGTEIEFMVQANSIRRIEIIGSGIKTNSGVGVGNTEAEVLSTYGQAVVVSRTGSDLPGHDYVTYVPLDEADEDFRMRFETQDNIVTKYWIGELPNVEWVDRCR